QSPAGTAASSALWGSCSCCTATAMISTPRSGQTDTVPTLLDLAQQPRHLVEHRLIILQMSLTQARLHEVVQIIQIGCYFATFILVQRITQAADDAEGVADQFALERDVAVLHCPLGLGQALQSTLHQHLDQPMRIRLGYLGVNTDGLVLLHCVGIHKKNIPITVTPDPVIGHGGKT